MFSDEELRLVIDIMNGAAFADGSKAAPEGEAIERALKELVGAPLDTALTAHIRDGSADGFDLAATCEALKIWQPESRPKRRLLFRLIAEVTEVDNVLDASESRYLLDVARFVGAPRHELEDMKGRGGWITNTRKPAEA